MSYGEVLARIGALQRQLGMPSATAQVGIPASASAGTSAAARTLTASALGLDGTGVSGFDTAYQDALASLSPGGTSPTGQTATSGWTGSARADGDDIAAWGSRYTGTPYVAGGRAPSSGWDCAGFTHWVYESYGIAIPEVSWEQVKQGTAVDSLAAAQPGDLLFFHEPGGHNRDPGPMKINHVAIYLGDGKMVEAANPRRGTVVSAVDTDHLQAIRRVAPVGDGVARTPTELAQSVLGTLTRTPRSSLVATPAVAPVSAAAPAGPAASGSLSAADLTSVLRRAGFSGESLRIAWSLAMRESGGQPSAVGKVNGNGTRDHGLFQLNDIHLGRTIDASQVYDADANAAAAYRLSRGGTDWSAWGLGDSGWAAHLRDSVPSVYADLQARFQRWYDRFPAALAA